VNNSVTVPEGSARRSDPSRTDTDRIFCQRGNTRNVHHEHGGVRHEVHATHSYAKAISVSARHAGSPSTHRRAQRHVTAAIAWTSLGAFGEWLLTHFQAVTRTVVAALRDFRQVVCSDLAVALAMTKAWRNPGD
jgi:hypothetical protein